MLPKLKEKAYKKSLVIIRAESEVEHGRVVRIMDIIKSQDLNRIAIAVDVETQTEESKNN